MARWLIVQLAHGRLPDGSRLFSDDTWRQLTTMVTPMPIGKPPPELAALRPNFRGYALGLNGVDYRGQKVLMHTGGLPGYVSRVMMIPVDRLGVAVLTNQESGRRSMRLPIALPITILVRGTPIGLQRIQKAAARRSFDGQPAIRATRSTRHGVTSFTAARQLRRHLHRRVVRRHHCRRGRGEARDALLAHAVAGRRPGALAVRHFAVRWRDRELRADAFVTFALNADGSIDQARMKPISPATDFSFDFQDLLLRRH